MYTIPKGTKDVLCEDAYKWHYVENAARQTAANFGFKEIRTPVFEHTELFLRGVGETTDIVTKEMYTFLDKGDRSITLKPEGTAGVARAFVGGVQQNGTLPYKMYYITPVFRYERPQAGRLREHHQFGVELYGSSSPLADVEVIALAKSLFDALGLKDLTLNINSIGCQECRAKYNAALKEYLGSRFSEMCRECQSRFEKNPLRILDCKDENCKKITADAPKVLDFLCDECKAHFEGLKVGLNAVGIEYKVNPQIVRGLDYYTKTVFEFVSNAIGAQGTVCGGGRYDRLVEEVGGKPTPAVGFGMGLERLLIVLESQGLLEKAPKENVDYYLASIGENALNFTLKLANKLRQKGKSVEFDLMSKSVKAQMKYANKIEAKYVIVVGDDEILSGKVRVKDMASGNEEEIEIKDL
ncbi:MAG: histidine--tRNA ligase [Eubacteriales bacterium]|nr:histidine--tRNA ligase [Eubacteriales bacterium]